MLMTPKSVPKILQLVGYAKIYIKNCLKFPKNENLFSWFQISLGQIN